MPTVEGVLQHTVIGPFSGLATIFQGDLLEDKFSPDLDNVIIEKGEIRKRKGVAAYGAALDDRVTGFHYVPEIYSANADYLLAATRKSIYVYNTPLVASASPNGWTYATSGQNIYSSLYSTALWAVFPNGDVCVTVNALNGAKKITPGAAGSLPTASTFDTDSIVTYAKYILNYLGWAVLLNTFESATQCYQRVRFNDGPGNIEDWTGGTAGYTDLSGHQDKIVAATVVGNKMVVFKNSSITIGNYLNATTPFGFDEDVITSVGLAAHKAFCLFPGGIFFLGYDLSTGLLGFNTFNLQSVAEVGLNVKEFLIENQATGANLIDYTHCIHVGERNEIWVFLSNTAGTTFNVLIWNYVKDTWTKFSFTATPTNLAPYSVYCGPDPVMTDIGGSTIHPTGSKNSVLFGTTAGQVYRFENVNTDAGSNFTGYWCTKDFQFVNARGAFLPNNKQRVVFVRLHAYADTAATALVCQYSVDGGTNYTTFATLALTTTPTVYEIPIDCYGHMVRFKFSGAGAGQFRIKGFTVHYIDKEVVR